MNKTKIPKQAKKVFDGVIYDVYQWEQELFDGSTTTFEIAKRADAVSIIPIIDDKLVILHEEQPHRGKTIGFPGGHIEQHDESPLMAAKRELQEETGMVFNSIKLVAIEDIGGAKLDWWIYRYIATNKERDGVQNPDPGERIKTELVEFKVAQKLAKNNVYMSHSIMNRVGSIDDLLALPEVSLN